MSRPTVSIIIPNLHSPVIDLTLDALRRQTAGLAGVEIIVVGLDKHRLIQPDETVRFVRTPQPVCAAAARNLGIAQAQGEILAFLDADCVPAADWLAHLLTFFSTDEIDVLAGGVAFPADEYWTLADNIANFYSYLSTAPAGERAFLLSLNFSLRRAVLAQVGLFDERFEGAAGEDTDLTLRLKLAGYRLRFEPSAVVYHRPVRNNLRQLVRRAFIFGRTTLRVYRRYDNEMKMPLVRRHASLLLLLAPLLGAAITAKIFLENRQLWPYWYTAPAVYLAKVLWRVGGAYELWTESRGKQNVERFA